MSVIKKKRVSKKNKLSWRKHVDIEDVENFLEDQRLEERLGKPVADKTDEELFHIDTDTKPSDTQQQLTSKQKRRLLLWQKVPKCFSMLQPHTEVLDPLIKRNRVKTKEERKNKLVKQKDEKRRLQGILKAKELQSLKDKKLYEIKRANKPKKGDFHVDIWSDAASDEILSSQWITNETRKHSLRGTGKSPKIVPKSVRTRSSVVPTIEAPHPGTSYNPSFGDHQALLQEVVGKEVKIIKKETHLNRVTKAIFSKLTPAQRDKNWLAEMSEGLPKNDEEYVDEDEGQYKSVNPPVKNKKKNLKQRRKQKEQQQLEQAQLIAKREKKKIADVYKLRLLKKQLDKHEIKTEMLRAKRLKKEMYKQKEPKRLAALKFEEEEIDINSPQDIKGNLRNIKKEGSLLMDRFKSMQKRNILQPTTKHVPKRAKVKRFQRSGHKDDWKTTVARPKNTL